MAERKYSLGRRLVVLLLVTVGLAWLAVAGLGYVAAHHEADELFDAQLANTAQTLLAIVRAAEVESVAEIDEHIHEYQLNLLFQVWHIEDKTPRLLLRCDPAPLSPLAEQTGFSERNFNGENWRVLGVQDDEYRVFVAQHHGVREELATNISLNLILPLVIGMPLLGIAVWLSVRRGLTPLRTVARDVALREPESLAPLPDDGLPDEIVPVVRALNALFLRVVESFERERRFTADAAHELRTPLAVIRVQAQVALESADDAERRSALKNLILGIDRQSHLVEQLLTLSRLDATARLSGSEAVDIRAVINDVLALLSMEIERRQVQVNVDVTPDVRVRGDRELLAVLLRNLVSNAVQYAPPPARIAIDVRMDNGCWQLCVTDNGPGIPSAFRGQVRERFARLADNGTSGSGLGLSIVSRIASLHGATLELRDNPAGAGLRACIRFAPQ